MRFQNPQFIELQNGVFINDHKLNHIVQQILFMNYEDQGIQGEWMWVENVNGHPQLIYSQHSPLDVHYTENMPR